MKACHECDELVNEKDGIVAEPNTEMECFLCRDCAREEATRQMVADAPGVWPDWALSLL